MSTYIEKNKNERFRKRRKDDESYDEDDDKSVDVSYYDEEEFSGESLDEDASLSELEAFQMNGKSNVESKQKKLARNERMKKKSSFTNPETKIKKSRFEFPYEAMDVSDEEEENERENFDKWEKGKANTNVLKKKIYEIMKVNKKKKKRKTKKRTVAAKTERKTGKMKYNSKGRKCSTKRKPKNSMEQGKPMDLCNSTKFKTKNETEQNANKNNNLDNGNNNDIKNPDKTNTTGDTATIEKTITNEKKASVMANKSSDPAEIKSKTSKENRGKEVTKDSKAREKVEDLRKKVDGKKVKNLDETVTSTVSRSPKSSGTQKLKLHTAKILRMTSDKTKKKV